VGRVESGAEQFDELALAAAFAAFDDDDHAALVDDLRQLGLGKPVLLRGQRARDIALERRASFKIC